MNPAVPLSPLIGRRIDSPRAHCSSKQLARLAIPLGSDEPLQIGRESWQLAVPGDRLGLQSRELGVPGRIRWASEMLSGLVSTSVA